MICKKVPPRNKKCMCLKRYNGGCISCEKNARKVVKESGRDLHETITDVKETGETIHDLYVKVNGIDGDPDSVSWRSAIDILRGVCHYCKHISSHACNECMWASETNSEDRWTFDERFNMK